MTRLNDSTAEAIDPSSRHKTLVTSGPENLVATSNGAQLRRNQSRWGDLFEMRLGVFTVLCLALVAFDIFAGVDVSEGQRRQIAVLVSLLGFNTLHVMFSLVTAWNIPEFRTVLVNHFNFNPLRQALAFGAILGLFLLVHDVGFAKDLLWLRGPCIFALVFFHNFHGTRQTLGLSLLINSDPNARERNSVENEQRSRTWEHRASWLFLAALLPTELAKYSVELKLPVAYAGSSKQVAIFLFVAGLIATFICIRFGRNNDTRVRKSVFSLRYVVRGLSPFSPFALMYSAAIHGLEYLDVQIKTYKNSSMEHRQRRKFLIVCFALLAFKLVLDLALFLPALGLMKVSVWSRICVVISATLTYFHFLTDSLVFRMRDPVIRQKILPLISIPSNANDAKISPVGAMSQT